MPDEIDGTSPDESLEQTSPDTGSAEGASPAGESPETAAESPSAEEIARWRNLEAEFKRQNVDPSTLLPEFTRRSQRLQQYEDYYAQIQQQQRQTQDPLEDLYARIAEHESRLELDAAAPLRRKAVELEAQRAAQRFVAEQFQRKQADDVQSGVIEEARRYGIGPHEIGTLSAQVARDPKALALAMAMSRDPNAAAAVILKDRENKARERKERERLHSLVNSGGRQVPGEIEEQESGPMEIPAAQYAAYPPAFWKKEFPGRTIKIV